MTGDRWDATRLDSGEVHVTPRDDLVGHPPDDCPCGPATKPVPHGDGSMGWLVTHHSLDGREQTERGDRG